MSFNLFINNCSTHVGHSHCEFIVFYPLHHNALYSMKGERKLASDKDNFERAMEDKFTLDAPNLGKLKKITIGHNNRGSSAGWCLDKVCSSILYIHLKDHVSESACLISTIISTKLPQEIAPANSPRRNVCCTHPIIRFNQKFKCENWQIFLRCKMCRKCCTGATHSKPLLWFFSTVHVDSCYWEKRRYLCNTCVCTYNFS